MAISPLALPAHAVAKHEGADANQQERQKNLAHPEKIEKAKIVEKEKTADGNQNDRAQRATAAPGFKGIVERLARFPHLRGAHGVDGHIENEGNQHEHQHAGHAIAKVATQAQDDRAENHNVDDGFVVFAVIDRAEAGNKSEKKSDRRVAIALWAG